MQEVVCYNCGRIVHVSPDAELCSVCSENLHELLHPVYASKYFYDRAAQLAAGSQLLPALQEIDRGLTYQPSSELRLLGAILSKRIGDFEQMRHHVAAIPVDDVLRPEGEWLLRSHQMRLRELRAANKPTSTSRSQVALDEFPTGFAAGFSASDAEIPRAIQQVHPRIASQILQKATKRGPGSGLVFVCLLVFVLAGSTLLVRNPQWVALLRGQGRSVSDSAPDLAEPVRQPTAEQTLENASPAPALDSTPVLTPTLAPDVPDNVVEAAPAATFVVEEVAASTPGGVISINAAQSVDLQSHLLQLNRTDLAQLQVAATLQGTVISLQGIVPTFETRQALIEAAQSVPGATNVSAVDLLLRLPATYTVQTGDTLWDITYRLYGDVAKIPVLLDANRTILPSPEQLTVGMELTVPPIE